MHHAQTNRKIYVRQGNMYVFYPDERTRTSMHDESCEKPTLWTDLLEITILDNRPFRWGC